MAVYKQVNKLVMMFWLQNGRIKDACFRPELILRRFYKIRCNVAVNMIFQTMHKIHLPVKIKRFFFSDMRRHAGHE